MGSRGSRASGARAAGSSGPPCLASSTAGRVKVKRLPRPDALALGPDAPAVRLDQPLADDEPEAGVGDFALAAAGGAGVPVEEEGQPLGRDPPALVGDRDRDVDAVACGRDPDRRGLRRVPGGVGEEVAQHLGDAPAVGHHPGQVGRQVDEHGVAAAAREEGGSGPVHQHRDLRGLGRDREGARLDAPRIEQGADKAAHVPGLLVDDAVELVHLGRVEVRRILQQGGGRALDGGERGAQLVAYHAEELGAQPLQLLERRQVLHGDHHRGDFAAVRPDGCGVDQRAHAAPVRNREHDLLGAHRFAGAELVGEGELVQGHLAAVGPADGDDLTQLLRRAARRAQALDDAPRLAVERHRPAGPGIEHHHADRRSLDQGLEVGPRLTLVAMRARVGDRRRRLAGEQEQDLLVLVGELGRALLLGEEEIADMDAAVAHRRAQEGLGAHQVRGEAERADEGREVGQPDRSGQVAEVREQLRPVSPLDELVLLVGREARGDELAHLAPLVDGGDDAVARDGQRAGAVGRLLQHGGDVEARAHAQHRRAERGDPLAQHLDLAPRFAVLVQEFLLRTRPGDGPRPGRGTRRGMVNLG